MKRDFSLFLALVFCLLSFFSCGDGGVSANRLQRDLKENRALFLQAVTEMTALHRDRAYAVWETPEKKEDETSTAEAEPRLVWYVKKSDTHKDFEAPAVKRLLTEFSFVLLYLQTDSDGRRCLIFSAGLEKDALVRGICYSFDGAPCGWWGRKADLKKKNGRWLQIQTDPAAWYYTISLGDSFYFFEKSGSLAA